MNDNNDTDQIDWELTTFRGAKKEALKRWAALPLEKIIASLEEMQMFTNELHKSENSSNPQK